MTDRQIIYYYQRGVASYLIAKKLGVSNNYIRNVLKRHKIKIRSPKTANRITASRRTPEENKKITAKAAEANLGSIHSASHRNKLALSREKKPTIDPVYEKPLIELCKKSGIAVIPQKAFGRFNVDLYLPEKNIIIEIFGGGFHNKQVAVETFNHKMLYLSKKGVPVLVVWAEKSTYNPQKVLEAALKVKEPLVVINGDGSFTKRGVKDIVSVQQSL